MFSKVDPKLITFVNNDDEKNLNRVLIENSEWNKDILSLSFLFNSKKIAFKLIDMGIDVNANVSGYSPLHVVCQTGELDMLEKLIDSKVDVNNKCDKFSPLSILIVGMDAESDDRFKMIKILVENGANVNEDCAPPLSCAIEANSAETVKYLLGKGSNVNWKDKMGISVLRSAITYENLEIVKAVVEAGASKELGVLSFAVDTKNFEIVRYLLSKYKYKAWEFTGAMDVASSQESYAIVRYLAYKDEFHDNYNVSSLSSFAIAQGKSDLYWARNICKKIEECITEMPTVLAKMIGEYAVI